MAESRRKGIRLVIILCVIVALAVTGVLIWTSRRATVRFYSEQGALDSISVSIGGTIEQPKDPTAKDKGYAFAGWYSDPGYTTEFDFDLPIERDTTIYVKWVERTFTVTVVRVTNTGSFNEVLWSSSGKYKSTITLPTKDTSTTYQDLQTPKYNFQRANQTFIGFATKANASGDFGYQYLPGADFTIPNDSIFLYAIFRGAESSFIFNPNDADGETKNETGYFNEYFTVPSSDGLSKQYYSFAYWCTDADGIPRDSEGYGCDINSPNCVNVYYPGQTFKVTNTAPLTLYAIWERNQVNVMLDARGGYPSTGVVGDNLVDAGLEGGYDLSLIEAPTRDGYRLIGYNTLETGLGTNYAIDDVIEVGEEDINLYAIWAKELTVGYSLNNTKVSDDDLHSVAGYDDFVGIEGETFTILGLPVTIIIPNFTFLGWSLDETATAADFHQGDVFTLREADFVHGDKLILYGVWRGDSRTLKLKNTADNQIQEISSYYGRREKLTSSAIHTDTNYYFVGWGTLDNYDYKNPGNYTGTVYGLGEYFEMGTNSEPGQANDILYSLWCPYSYDVTYYMQGGELTVAPGESAHTKAYVYKESVTLYSSVAREGYRFMGWSYSANSQECAFYDNGEGTGYTLVMPGNSFQLYAVWSREYTISFLNNAEGATGLVTPITGVILGETFKIPTEAVSNSSVIRENYSIVAWSTQAEGGTTYNFEDSILLESSDLVTFYAVWKGDARNIQVYDGNTLITTIEGEYGTDIPLVFETEIENDDPGYEIGGFYALIEVNMSGTVQETRYDFAYGDNVKTTNIYFQDKDSNPVDTLKVYIVWNKKYFTVTYELNGGIYNNDDNDDMSAYRIYEQYTNTVTLEPLVPTKNKYEFKGWTEDVDNPVEIYAADSEYTIPARNVTLYALWARIYTLSYSSNGGELASGQEDLGSQSYAKGTRVTVPNSPYTKTYYTFSTWNTRADGQGTDYSIGSSLEITADVTLYAIWLGQEVNLTLIASDPGDGAYNYQVTVSPNPRYGDNVSISTYATSISAPAGLQLKGWKLSQPSELDVDVDYTNDYLVDQVGSIQLFSVWSPKSYYFIIGLNGGIYNKTYNDHSTPTPFRTKIELSKFTTGTAPIAKEGYRLLGFSDNADATVPSYGVDAIINMPAESKKIYCVWQELTVITFDKNCDDTSLTNYVFNGVLGDAELGAVNLTSVNATFRRTNYTLLGWSTSSTAAVADAGFDAGTGAYTVQDTNDIYLYAVWEGRAITVRFNNNPDGGGNSSTTEYAKKYGDEIDLTDSVYQRTNTDPGFAFGGWSTTSGEGNNGGIVGNVYKVSTTSEDVSIVYLYAIWNKKYFTLTYDYGDSTLGSKTTPDGFDSRSVQYTSTVDVTEFVTHAKKRLGYDFMGWSVNIGETDLSKVYGRPNGSGGITNVNFTMPNANVTLHAIWEPIYVPIIYKSETPSGATEQWIGVGTNTSYTVQQLYQLSFTLPSNTIETGIGVYVSSYRFVGWKVEGDTSNLIRAAGESFQVNVREYITLLAQWEENIISVVVNANGGIITGKDSSTATYSVREKNNFPFLVGDQITRSGHRLVSYTINNQVYDINSVTEIQITTALMSAEDMTTNTVRMTANWIKQVTVTFNKNGKYGETITGTIEDRVFDAGTSTILPDCTATEGFQRTYYKFIGWNEYSDGTGTTFLAGATYTPSFDTNLYAVWEGNDRTVVLHYSTNQPGTPTGESATEKTITGLKYGSMLDTSLYSGTATNDTKYKLEGWTQVEYQIGMTESQFVATYLQSSKIEITGTDSSPTVHYYAVWVARDFKVTYNANGGVFYSDGTSTTKAGATTQADDNFAVSSGTTGDFAVRNPATDRNFYTFVGWSTNSSMSWENASSKMPASYAEINPAYIYSATATNNVFGFVMPASDVTLYAVWEPVLITIEYYAEATDSTAHKTENIRYGTTITLLEGVTKADNNFGEWIHVDADKTTEIASYKAGTSLKIYNTNLSETEQKMSTKKVMFIAKWIPQTVYVQIIGNGGQFEDGTDSRLFETSVGRKFALPAISDANNQLVYVNFALKSFNLKQNGSSTHNFSPGVEITIPSLTDNRLTQETITLDNGEEVSTYIYTLYAQWVAAEAYINRSSNELENPYYESLAGAIADANSGETVKILKDCYIKSAISINKQIILEPFSTTDSIDLNIYRYVDTANASNSYNGILFNIGTDGMLTVGENTQDELPYSIIFDGQASSTTTDSIFSVSGNLRLYNGVVVRNNLAVNGGAITMTNANASAVIYYVTFEENEATTNGGAIYSNLASNVEIKYCLFEQNVAGTAGGAIYNNKIMQIQENEFSKNESTGNGGAVYNTDVGQITDKKNTYTTNEARTSGGAIYSIGVFTIEESTFTSNFARSSGGAIYNAETASASLNMIVTSSTFGNIDDDSIGNSSSSAGGAIANFGKLSLTGSNFYYNSVQENGNGGAVLNDGTSSSLILNTCLFEGNSAKNGYGGAVANRNGISSIGEEGVSSSTVTFKNNTVYTGRGFSLSVTGGTSNIFFAEFTEHIYEDATSYGGVVFQNSGILNFYGGSIYANKITQGLGGGLLVSGGTCNINTLLIYGNEAKYGGGIAMLSSGTVVMNSGEIYENTAAQGGGIFMRDKNAVFRMLGGVVGSTDTDSSNKAQGFSDDAETILGNGGGIYSAGTVTINGGVVKNNTASANGAGIYSVGSTILVAGSITGNVAAMNGGAIYADSTGGGTNGTVTFTTSTNVKFLIQNNLCADGAYKNGVYDDSNGTYYANGIYTSKQTIISGYLEITSNGKMDDEEILNDIFIAVRDNQNNPTNIVVFSQDDSNALNEDAEICISSKLAQMGDKLVKFPSPKLARENVGKFTYAGDESGFRVKDSYLILGNYAAIIMRDGEEVFYQTLTEAYLAAQEGEEIIVYKNVNIADDLQIYNEESDLADAQEALVGGVDITSSFYIGKKVTIVGGAEYEITRGSISGDLFTVVNGGQLTLGSDSPIEGSNLIIKGDAVETGSLIKVEAHADDEDDVPKFILNDGVTLTGNTAAKGSAIYAEAYIKLIGGTITKNTATESGGAIYSTKYIEMSDSPIITENKAYTGAGIYIANSDTTVNSLTISSATAKITKNNGTFAGGGIYIEAGKVTITACEISENKAATEYKNDGFGGGGIYVGVGGILITNQKTANDATNAGNIKIIKNESETYGGGVVIDNGSFTHNIGTIAENDAGSMGGGVAVINTAGTGTTATGVFTTLNSSYHNYINSNTATNGAGIAIVAGTANVSYIKMSGNDAASNGGGILNRDKLIFGKYAFIGNVSTTTGNKSGASGAGIYNDTTGVITQVDGNTSEGQNLIVAYNQAAAFGGGIANNGTITFTFFTDIYNNRADAGAGIANLEDGTLITKARGQVYRNSTTGTIYGGGGLYNIGTTKIESNYQFGSTANIANGNSSIRGGGVYNGGTLIIGSSTEELNITTYFNYNTATLFGGGIYMNKGSFTDYSIGPTHVSNNRQESNVGGGAGMSIAGGDATIKASNRHNTSGSDISGHTNCHFYIQNNSAGGAGAGVYITDTGELGVTFNGTRISSNSAAGRGGGLAIQGGIVRFCDPASGQVTLNTLTANTCNIGAAIYLETTLQFNCNLTNWWDGGNAWNGEIYLANPRSYLNFSKKNEDTSYAPDNVTLYVKANDYTDGRRIAKFGSYTGIMQLPNNDGGFDNFEYEGTFAETYYTKFSKLETGIRAGITYDDNGYVVFAEPVATNLNRNTTHSTLADAALKAQNGDYILIEKSHTVTDQVFILDKSLNFVITSEIILTRSPKLFTDMFRVFATNTATSYKVNFNKKETKTFSGTSYSFGNGVSLTLDGNKSHPTLLAQTLNKWGPAGSYSKYSARGSLIGVSGGLYAINDDNSFKKVYTQNAGHLFGHTSVNANSNWALYGAEITTSQYVNANVHPARVDLSVYNTTFRNNFSAYSGGAITWKAYTSSSNTNSSVLTLENCDFINNETGYYSWQGTVRGPHYTFYQSGAGGGAVFALGGRVVMQYCDFDGNISATHGGAVSLLLQEYYSSYTTNNTSYIPISIKYCNFTNNISKQGNGGAVEIVAYKKGNITISECSFTANESYTHGGALYLMRTGKTYAELIEEGYVHGNGHGLLPWTYEVIENYTYTWEGNTYTCPYPISVHKSTSSYEKWTTTSGMPRFEIGASCTFEGNKSGAGNTNSGSGGAIFARHYLYITGTNSVKISDNYAEGNGGGMWLGSVSYFDSTSLEVSNNTAKSNGGGLYYDQAPGLLKNTIVTGNTANDGGGAYFNVSSGVTSITATYNEALNNGGGLYFKTLSKNYILGGSIDNNSAAKYGGGIAVPTESGAGTSIAFGMYNVASVSRNRAGQRGGGIYCYSSMVIFGEDTYISDNEVYSSSTSAGGGGGIWCNWEALIAGSAFGKDGLYIQNNKITADSALTNGGGAGIYIGNHSFWMTNIVSSRLSSTSSQATALTDPDTYVKAYDRGANTYYTRYNSGYAQGQYYYRYVYKEEGYSSSTTIGYSQTSISGNDAGLSEGDGLYYAGSKMYMSGVLKIEDEMYMKNSTAAKIIIDGGVPPLESVYKFSYPNQPNDGTVFVEVVNKVPFSIHHAIMFGLTDDTYYVEKSAGTYSASLTDAYRADDVLKLAMKKGSVRILMTADTANGETFNGTGMADFTAAWGEALISIYRQVAPHKAGFVFNGFEVIDDSGTVLKTYNWSAGTGLSSYGAFLTRTDATSLYGVLPTEIRLRCRWKESSYTLRVAKYILETDTTFGSKSTYASQYSWSTSASNTNSYSYTIVSGQSFEPIITDLETAASEIDSTKTKNYVLGYEVMGYMLSYDRKYYTKTDKYPYTFASDGYKTFLFIVYKTAEYSLTFNADADSELQTENNVIKTKYGQYVSLLSPNLIYRKGYKLVAWKGSDGASYIVDTQTKETDTTQFELKSNDATYPWTVEGTSFTSSVHTTRGGESEVRITAKKTGYLTYKFKTDFRGGYEYFYVRKYVGGGSTPQQLTYTNTRRTYFANSGSYAVNAGDDIAFVFKTSSSYETGVGTDTIYITDVKISTNQTAYSFVSNMTFEPVWEAETNELRVYYNYPDGGTSFKLYSIKTGEVINTYLTNDPISNPTGYELLGYSTTSDGSTGLMGMEDLMPGEAVTLYAQWKPIKVTISYYDENYITILHQEEVDYGAEVQVWETDGVAVWLNIGSQALYDPKSSYLVNSADTLKLSFRAYNPNAA